MTGDRERGDAAKERWEERFAAARRDYDVKVERLKVRAELKSQDFEEDTGVIHVQAEQRVAEREEDSVPPPSRVSPLVIVLTVVKKFPPVGAVLVALAAIAAYVILKLRGALP